MQRVPVWLAAVSLGVGMPGLGCAHRDPADRSVDQLKTDISQLQADRDRLDQRLGALETAEHEREGAGKPPGPDARTAEPPRRLPVVRVGEGDSQEGEPGDEVD